MLPGFERAFEEIIKLLDNESSVDMSVVKLIKSIVGYNPFHTLVMLKTLVDMNKSKIAEVNMESEPDRLLEDLAKKMSTVEVLTSTLIVSDNLIDPFNDEMKQCSDYLTEGDPSKIIGITGLVMSFDKGAALMELHKLLTSGYYKNEEILTNLRELVDLVRRYENSLREERSPTYRKSSQHLGDYSAIIGSSIDKKIASIEQIAESLRTRHRRLRGQELARRLRGIRATRAMFNRYDTPSFTVSDGKRGTTWKSPYKGGPSELIGGRRRRRTRRRK
jgi:hypothetical protein